MLTRWQRHTAAPCVDNGLPMQGDNDVAEDVAALFERHRPSITGLAYRMIGSVAEAQDIAQETYLRFRGALEVRETVVQDAKAFLHKVAARLCLDHLKTARVRREAYVGTWLPEPTTTDGVGSLVAAPSPAEHVHDISFALLLTLDRLTPPERAAFLLHDVFDLSFAEIAEAIGQEPASCRQLASRARRHIAELKPRFQPPPEIASQLIQAFLTTLATGDVDAICGLLAQDAVLYSDGGGKVLAALKPIHGGHRIARFYGGVLTKFPPPSPLDVRLAFLNGLPGAVIGSGGSAIQTFAFEIDSAGQIKTMYTTRNPEKLLGLSKLFSTSP